VAAAAAVVAATAAAGALRVRNPSKTAFSAIIGVATDVPPRPPHQHCQSPAPSVASPPAAPPTAFAGGHHA